jgi:anti-sigma factor RsiW
MKKITFRHVEQLSAHLDGNLSQAESVRIESELKADPNLRAVMDDLSQSRALLRKLPQRRAPRNFTLTPKMAGVKPPLPRAVPALRWATSLAALLLLVTFATNALAPVSSASMAYGIGGGRGGGPETMDAATEAPLSAMESAPAATEAPAEAPSVESFAQPAEQALPTPDMTQKDINPEEPSFVVEQQPAPVSAPIPLAWQIGLLVVALASGGLAWILAALSDTSWRGKSK